VVAASHDCGFIILVANLEKATEASDMVNIICDVMVSKFLWQLAYGMEHSEWVFLLTLLMMRNSRHMKRHISSNLFHSIRSQQRISCRC